jgi:outer membrane receptor protein involved in Fe transport
MKQSSNEAGLRLPTRALAEAVGEALRSVSATGAKSIKPSILAVSGGAILASALVLTPATPAFAQDEPAAIEEITVTGSRIRRQDFTANAPIHTVTEELFAEMSAIGVETVLNRLPQFVPAITQFTTGAVQQTATNTVGASTVSLRGLGPNRNLVLINGRRGMPVDPRMIVDTNSIPSGAIQRVEVISGGASAVYGADAVGGVVNFILRDDFEGARIDFRFGDTQHGGDQTTSLSALIGANSPDGRGNVMIGLERDTRSKQWIWERDWRVQDLANPNTGGGFFTFGSTTWFHLEPGNTTVPNPNFDPNEDPGPTNPLMVTNNPSQAVVDSNFDGPTQVNQLQDAVTMESKVFSIYATGFVRSGKHETRSRIHAVVDFRGSPPPGSGSSRLSTRASPCFLECSREGRSSSPVRSSRSRHLKVYPEPVAMATGFPDGGAIFRCPRGSQPTCTCA